MFSLISGFWQYFFTKPQVNILLVGLDYAGKTTILEQIKHKFAHLPAIPPDRIPPTIGMNLGRVTYHNHQFIIWDLGGQFKMRNMWEKYYEEAHAIIFVVDSNDAARLEEAKLAYEAICDHDSVTATPVLILANKQDLPGALTPSDIAINFYSVQDAADRSRVFPVSALTGQGLESSASKIFDLAIAHLNQKTNR